MNLSKAALLQYQIRISEMQPLELEELANNIRNGMHDGTVLAGEHEQALEVLLQVDAELKGHNEALDTVKREEKIKADDNADIKHYSTDSAINTRSKQLIADVENGIRESVSTVLPDEPGYDYYVQTQDTKLSDGERLVAQDKLDHAQQEAYNTIVNNDATAQQAAAVQYAEDNPVSGF